MYGMKVIAVTLNVSRKHNIINVLLTDKLYLLQLPSSVEI